MSQPAASSGRPPDPDPPKSFVAIHDIGEARAGASIGKLIHVMGMVTRFMAPIGIPNKNDYKCAFELAGLPVKQGDYTPEIKFNVFRPLDEMPPPPEAGDVVVIHHVKVQKWVGVVSLITNRETRISIYKAADIPRYPEITPRSALRGPASPKDKTADNESVRQYVSYFYHKLADNDVVPDESTFAEGVQKSVQIKDRFSLLADVQVDHFYDMIVHVAKEPWVLDHISGRAATIYVSDYTENERFYDKEKGPKQDADVYNYTAADDEEPQTQWVGPYGRRSMQVTCWGLNAEAVDSSVRAGDWLLLRNVRIKLGAHDHNNYLEGALHDDRERVNVFILDSGDGMDGRLKDAQRRHDQYFSEHRKKANEVKAATVAGQKRKVMQLEAFDSTKSNSKSRRREKRHNKELAKSHQEQHRSEPDPELNDQVVCEVNKTPVSPIRDLLKTELLKQSVGDQTVMLPMPFVNAKYKAKVRVVDFRPDRLEDWAVKKSQIHHGNLSGNDESSYLSSQSPTPSPPTPTNLTDAARAQPTRWEWRFSLYLEDASLPDPKRQAENNRIWVLVDNMEAQCLLSLDAADLRRNEKRLGELRRCLETLWGDLEEHKRHALDTQEYKQQQAAAKKSREKERARNRQPPAHSSGDEGDDRNQGQEHVEEDWRTAVTNNQPFKCCIRQYGVKRDGGWERAFGLFGTSIKNW